MNMRFWRTAWKHLPQPPRPFGGYPGMLALFTVLWSAVNWGLVSSLWVRERNTAQARNTFLLKVQGVIPADELTYLELLPNELEGQPDLRRKFTQQTLASSMVFMSKLSSSSTHLSTLTFEPDQMEWINRVTGLNVVGQRFTAYRTVEGVELRPPHDMVKLTAGFIDLYYRVQKDGAKAWFKSFPVPIPPEVKVQCCWYGFLYALLTLGAIALFFRLVLGRDPEPEAATA
jgi:hypothetical protein